MRNPNRIYLFTQKLCYEWATNLPDMRFGQLISNAMLYHDTDENGFFYAEEDEMLRMILEYIDHAKEEILRWNSRSAIE